MKLIVRYNKAFFFFFLFFLAFGNISLDEFNLKCKLFEVPNKLEMGVGWGVELQVNLKDG